MYEAGTDAAKSPSTDNGRVEQIAPSSRLQWKKDGSKNLLEIRLLISGYMPYPRVICNNREALGCIDVRLTSRAGISTSAIPFVLSTTSSEKLASFACLRRAISKT